MIPRRLIMEEYRTTHEDDQPEKSRVWSFRTEERVSASCGSGRMSLSSLCVVSLMPCFFVYSCKSCKKEKRGKRWH